MFYIISDSDMIMLFRYFLFFFFDKKKRKYLRPKEKKNNDSVRSPRPPSLLSVAISFVILFFLHHASCRWLVVYHSALATNKSTLV